MPCQPAASWRLDAWPISGSSAVEEVHPVRLLVLPHVLKRVRGLGLDGAGHPDAGEVLVEAVELIRHLRAGRRLRSHWLLCSSKSVLVGGGLLAVDTRGVRLDRRSPRICVLQNVLLCLSVGEAGHVELLDVRFHWYLLGWFGLLRFVDRILGAEWALRACLLLVVRL